MGNPWDSLPEVGEINPKTGRPFVKSKKTRWLSRRSNKRTYDRRPDIKAEIGRKARIRQNTPAYKARASAVAKKAHARPETIARRRAIYDDPDYRARLSVSMKKAANTPEQRKRRQQQARETNRRPEVRSKISKALREYCKGKSTIGRHRSHRSAWIYYFRHPSRLSSQGGKLGFCANVKTLRMRRRSFARDGWGKGIGENGWMAPGEFIGFDLCIHLQAREEIVPFDIEQFLLDEAQRPVHEVVHGYSVRKIRERVLSLSGKYRLDVLAVKEGRQAAAFPGHEDIDRALR